jgi:D-sedoheptulose 7-phosphate isomerase
MIVAPHYFQRLMTVIQSLDLDAMDQAISLIRSTWEAGKQVICFGNGGSALTAQHYMTDWNKSIYLKTGRPFYGRCLADNIGILTAYANDVSYADVFVSQLKPILTKGDLVMGISGSGNSENVLRAVAYAKQQGSVTLGIVGYDGGKLKKLADHVVWAPVQDMQLSEDIHLAFGHWVMQALCQEK